MKLWKYTALWECSYETTVCLKKNFPVLNLDVAWPAHPSYQKKWSSF